MIHFASELPAWLNSATHLGDFLGGFLGDFAQSIDVTMFAQEFKQTDIAGNVGTSWNHFVKTGQVWAFVIGAGTGYFVRTFTSFG